MSNDKASITKIARLARRWAHVFRFCESGPVWHMTAAGGPKLLSSQQADQVLEEIIRLSAESAQVAVPSMGGKDRRGFLSASQIGCFGPTDAFFDHPCPSCAERRALGPQLVEVLAEAGAR